jgi:FkbM family methyltransferase
MLRGLFSVLEHRFDLIICRGWRASRLDQERHLRRLFEAFRVDCVFDVGAHAGEFADMMRRYVGYHGPLVSFEPNPDEFRRLRTRAASDPLWHTEALALGRQPGEADLHVYSQSDLSSLRSLDPESKHRPADTGGRTVRVRVETLAQYLPQAHATFHFERPFLKMDTQGFDLEVAAGAGESLREFVALQSEVAFQSLYTNAPDYRTAIDFYQSAGFGLSRLAPIHEVNFPDLVEMDCIMVRRGAAWMQGR